MKKAKILLLALSLALALGACSGGGEQGTVRIAVKAGTESYITGELIALVAEEVSGLEVELTKDLASTELIQAAMERGEYDLAADYTSTAWIFVVGRDDFPDDETMYEELVRFYEEEKNMTWTGLFGFNNTFALTVPTALAQEHSLETYSDLAAVSSELVFGGNTNFVANETGLPGVSAAYDMEFDDVLDLAIGLNYPALEQGEIQVTNAFTTDAQLAVADVKVLEDDKGYFSNFYCGIIASLDILEQHEGLRADLEQLNGIIDDAQMAQMNYEVEIEGKDEREVARAFLQANGIID